jgi:ElaB/YqjD/DUF883 family membrane-anchored ribosome-binding protein
MDMATKDAETATAETLRDEIERLRADMAAIAGTLKDLGVEGGSKVYGRVRERAERVRGEAEQAANAVGQKIEERPLTAVLTAFILGAILGALISRR